MFTRKGQGTTEYLIILAIVIVIALVVVGVLGGFGSQGSAISAGQSKAYWGGVSPLSVKEWAFNSSGTATIVMLNQTSDTISVVDLNIAGATVAVTPDVNISGGQTVTLSVSASCGVVAGKTYSRTFGYTYSTANIPNLKFNGSTPLIGDCQ